MTQFSMAILACQKESQFAQRYQVRHLRIRSSISSTAGGLLMSRDAIQAGMKKADYWDPTFEDMLTLIARLPRIAALIYRHVFRNGEITKLVSARATDRATQPKFSSSWALAIGQHETQGELTASQLRCCKRAVDGIALLLEPNIIHTFLPRARPSQDARGLMPTAVPQENTSDMSENFVRMLGTCPPHAQ